MLCTSSYVAHKLQYSDRTFTKSFKAAYARLLSTYKCNRKFKLL